MMFGTRSRSPSLPSMTRPKITQAATLNCLPPTGYAARPAKHQPDARPHLGRRDAATPRSGFDQHRELFHIVIADKRGNPFKIATQIRLDDPEGAAAEVIGNGYLPLSRSVKYATSRQGLAAPRFSRLEYPRSFDRTPSTGG
jgi:hypothetical protein